MENLVCRNCGAPLDIPLNEVARRAAKCAFCGATVTWGNDLAPAPALEQPALPVVHSMNDPANRPPQTRVQLVNRPGVEFLARLPEPLAWRVLAVVLGGASLFWLIACVGAAFETAKTANYFCGLAMVSLPAWAVGVVCALYLFRNQNKIAAANGVLTIVRRRIFRSVSETFAWRDISQIQFETVRSPGQKPAYGLFVTAGDEKVPILQSGFTVADQQWVRTELAAFFAPIWGAEDSASSGG